MRRSLVAVSISLIAAGVTLSGQSGAPNGEWRTYGGDLGNTRYAPLAQIDKDNFNKLEVAWRFKADQLGGRPEYNYESTPLMVGGTIYVTAGSRRAVVALDAKTGYPIQTFGKNGIVDLKLDDDQAMDLVKGEIGLHATPVVAKNVVIVGAAHLPGSSPKSRQNEKGYVRGFDVRTGKRLWIFHTIPQLGEVGNDTWERESWTYTGNAGVWAQMSVDEDLGLVYLPVELPTGDYYGGHRPGAGLFGETIVAVDFQTGKRKWHYQLVHHGIWDMDIPCAPILADLVVNGRTIKALAQPTKQGWVYVFDRATGQPVWPIEERPVAKGDVPGEWYSPTQPFPTKPPAFDRQGVSVDDLIDFTPELRQQAIEFVSKYKIGPIFTPPVVSKWEGPRATLILPAATGGANWQGGSYDPDSKIMYVFSNTQASALGLVPPDEKRKSDMNFITGTAPDPNKPGQATGPTVGAGGESSNGLFVQGLPIIKPPYGRITAIDLNKGEIVWQIAHGETPDSVRNHPALKGVPIPRTGRDGRIGTLVTKSLVIAGEGGFFTLPDGRRGAMLRAYDKATGKDAGEVYMPAPQTGSPMTYMLNGKQYIVLAIGGGNYSAELVAYKLP